jgi:anhydro-N-acetylmuramic acid kinase
MTYKAIGLMSGSSLDGLDVVFAHFTETAGKWTYEVVVADCYPYTDQWRERLRGATALSARDYCLLDADYGHFLGQMVNRFSEEKNVALQADLIASHGHTTFHEPALRMTAQLGDGAALAAETGMAVISDLRAMDVALGGEGAPIVPVGESLLFPEYSLFLNLGGIANISCHREASIGAFDVSMANAVLNALASKLGRPYDDNGEWARGGQLNEELLLRLNALPYYQRPWPKSLANDFAPRSVLPLLEASGLSVQGQLRTYTEHLSRQVAAATGKLLGEGPVAFPRMLVTGGGAFNGFLVERLAHHLAPLGIEVVVPGENVVMFKEALIMAMLGILRWRERATTLTATTGARRPSIGGALWMGHDV